MAKKVHSGRRPSCTRSGWRRRARMRSRRSITSWRWCASTGASEAGATRSAHRQGKAHSLLGILSNAVAGSSSGRAGAAPDCTFEAELGDSAGRRRRARATPQRPHYPVIGRWRPKGVRRPWVLARSEGAAASGSKELKAKDLTKPRPVPTLVSPSTPK